MKERCEEKSVREIGRVVKERGMKERVEKKSCEGERCEGNE